MDMEYQYNAFISYRHTEIDMKVAEDVEKQLEQFRIPASIRKQYGIRRINRLFRDKDELPITSNINDDILNALDHSEYLIVICSPHTKESIWVDREIRRFLEMHDRKHVLTVIAEGMPSEVIPEILTYQEVERTAPDGTRYTEREQLEPLSCDYRIGFKKARKAEVPRLAAALIGCRYDDLIQRRKQRRNRILAGLMAAVTVVSTGAAAYVIRANSRISENYRQSLRNQSVYLSSESLTALKNGDKMTAVHLALAALPSEGNERPYTAKAEYALAKALAAYSLEGSGLSVTGSYVHNSAVNDFMISDDEKTLAVLDDSNTVYFYDTEILKQRSSVFMEKESGYVDIELLGFYDNSVFLFKKRETVYAYDVMTGEQRYVIDGREGFTEPDAVFIQTADHQHSSVILTYYDGRVIVCSPENGKKTAEYQVPPLPAELQAEDEMPFLIDKGAMSEDGRYIVMGTLFQTGTGFMENEYGLALIDLQEGGITILPVASSFISGIGFYGNDRIIYYELDESPDIHNSTSWMEGSMIITNSKGHVNALSVSGEKLWSSAVSTSQLSSFERIVPEHTGSTDCIIWCYADQVVLFDPDTGEIIEKCEMTDSVISMKVFANVIAVVTADGRLTTISPDDPAPWFSQPHFITGITKAAAGRNDWIITDNRKVIIQYEWDTGAESLEVLQSEEPVQYFLNSSVRVDDDGMLFFATGGHVYYSDGSKDSVLKYADISDFLTVIDAVDHKENLFTLTEGTDVWRLDISTGETEKKTLTPEDGYRITSDVFPAAGNLYYVESSGEKTYLVKEENGQSLKTELPYASENYQRWRLIISGDGRLVLAVCNEDEQMRCFFADCSASTASELTDTQLLNRPNLREKSYESLSKYIAFSSDSSLAAAAGESSVEIYDASGKLKTVLPELKSSVMSMSFTPDNHYLLTASEDGRLYRYDLSSGKMLDYTELESARTVTSFDWEFTDDYLMLNCDGNMNVISLDEMQITAVVRSCYGYLKNERRFIAGDSDTVAAVKHYTADELIEQGNRYLNGHELTVEQKAEYGLQ